MSLFFRAAPEKRAVTMADWIRGLDPASTAGERVTTTSSLKQGAVWSSVNLLASIVSNLPVDVVRGSGTSRTQVTPQPPIVGSPSLIVSRREWMYQAMVSLLLRGNAYGYIVERAAREHPRTVEWLDPDAVAVSQPSSLSHPTYSVGGDPVPREDLIHMRAFVRPGSAIGMSPIEYHAETIGVGLAARKYGAQWFDEGGHPSAIFKNEDQTLQPEETRKIKERIKATLRGKREPLVVGKGWSYQQIQVSASESQFLETQGYTDAQIARLYGPGLAEVLGYAESGSSLTYSNRVDRSLDLLTYAVMPWVAKFEDMLTGSIAQPQTVRFNTNSLLRADNKTRHEMFRIDREIGLYNIDELRALEDLPPLPDGLGQDYTPLKAAPAPNPGGQDGDE